jgi:hypothetical protein
MIEIEIEIGTVTVTVERNLVPSWGAWRRSSSIKA